MTFEESSQQRLSELVKELFPDAGPRPGKHGGTDYYTGDQFLCGLRPENGMLALHLMPLYLSKKIDLDYASRLKPWRAGKSSLTFNEQKPIDWAIVRLVLEAHRRAE